MLAYVREQKFTDEQVKKLFSKEFYERYLATQDAIPISIFKNDHLSSLETTVKYLKEDLGYRFVKIAELLNRSTKTVWATYANAARKMPERFAPGRSEFFIPLSMFHDRRHSPLEAVVRYLKDSCGQSYHQIALSMNRDDRTIWTTYNRRKSR